MHFLDFPNDVLFCVVDFVPLAALNSLLQTNRQLYSLFDPWLYRYDAPSSGIAALAWAAEHGYEEVARKALSAGAPVQPTTEHRIKIKPVAPLQIACRRGHVKVVELLLAQPGIDLNWTRKSPPGQLSPYVNQWKIDRLYMTPLMQAAQAGHADVVKLLFEQPGVNVEAKDQCQRTAMYLAIEGKHDSVIEVMLAYERGRALVHIPTHRLGPTFIRALHDEPLDIAWRLLTTDGLKLDLSPTHTGWAYELLMSRGLPEFLKKLFLLPNPRTKSGYLYDYKTPLAAAIAGGDKSTVQPLLADYSVDANGPDNASLTPLSLAICLENEELVQLLLDLGPRVDPNLTDNDGRAPLWIAASLGYTKMVKLLLSNDRVRPFWGYTYPHVIAAKHGHMEIVELLLARADIGKDNNILDSVLDVPAEHRPRVVEFLSSHGASIRKELIAKIAAKEKNDKKKQKRKDKEKEKRKREKIEKRSGQERVDRPPPTPILLPWY